MAKALTSKQARGIVRRGFTLVEVLMVIAIIGILAGLIIPAVSYALTAVKRKAIALEVEALASAVNQYKNKYGDYPPDGSNAAAFERHFRKVFPQIQSSEFTLLYTYANSPEGAAVVMDPAEALVFALGGFSSNPIYPFSGSGGPFFVMDSGGNQVDSSSSAIASVQYNVDRTNGFFDFKPTQLTIDLAGGLTISIDESNYFGATTFVAPAGNDLLPVYHPSGKQAPYVYFDARTYSIRVTTTGLPSYFNRYQPTSVSMGVARPYKSNVVNTTVSQATSPDTYFKYAEDKGFQIISAGLDDNYGGVGPSGAAVSAVPTFFVYPTGESLNIASGTLAGSRYAETSGVPSPQLDNATNFSGGTLEDGLEN